MSLIFKYFKQQFDLLRIRIVTKNKLKKLRTHSEFKSRSNFKPEQYTNKIILAPMVRVGTLPIRVLALGYGADLVYTEEISDWELIKTTRVVNDFSKTIDFVDVNDGTVLLQTCDLEKPKVILQISTADHNRALQAAQLAENDFAGIDVNMGCPKDYAVKRGTGAALLSQPELIHKILTTLVSNVKIPVTCKVRIFPTLEETIRLCQMIETTGVSAIAVHGRTKESDKLGPNNNDFIRAISKKLKIPVIANGDSPEIRVYDDIEKFQVKTNCSSVMIARAAEYNPSIFNPEGRVKAHEIMKTYLKLCIDFNNNYPNTKFNLGNFLKKQKKFPFKEELFAALSMRDLCALWELEDYYLDVKAKREEEASAINASSIVRDFPTVSSGSVTIVPDCVYRFQNYRGEELSKTLPKTVLSHYLQSQWSGQGQAPQPLYKSTKRQRRFRSIVSIDKGVTWYGTNMWNRNTRQAEQAATLALIKSMKISC